MILLKHLKLENFLSHPNTELEFGSNEKLLVDGVSGSGKSSLVEAIVWVLYGKGRVDNRNMVRKGQKQATVTLHLTDGENEYKIIRSTTPKAKNSLDVITLSEGSWNALERMGMRDIQDWIESELLHASYELFVNSIVYMQDNPDSFVKQTASRRKDLLLEILRVGEYADLYKKAASKLNDLTRDVSSMEGELRSAENLVSSLASSVIDIDAKRIEKQDLEKTLNTISVLLSQNTERISGLSVLQKQLSELVVEKNSIPKQKESLKNILQRIQKELEEIDNKEKQKEDLVKQISDIEDVEKEFQALQKRMENDQINRFKLQSLMSNKPKDPSFYDKKISEIEQQLSSIRGNSEMCPSGEDCPFTKPILGQIQYLESQMQKQKELKIESEKEIEEYQKDIVSIQEKIELPEISKLYDETRKKLDQKKMSKNLLESINAIPEKNIDIANKEFQEISLSIRSLEEEERFIVEKIDAIQVDINRIAPEGFSMLEERQATYDGEISILKRKIEFIEREMISWEHNNKIITEYKTIIAELKQKIETSRYNISSVEEIKEAFSQRGVPAVVIDYVIPKLEEKINEILSQLSEFKIKIETQRANSSGDGVVEGLFLNIYNEHGDEFDFDNYSGGQKLKITVAIAEALASLQKVGFRIFDEIFLSLDEQSTEEFTEVMDNLQTKFNQILCITHLRNVKDLFEDRVMIVRKNGESFISA